MGRKEETGKKGVRREKRERAKGKKKKIFFTSF